MLPSSDTGYFHFCALLESLKLPDLMQVFHLCCVSRTMMHRDHAKQP